MATNILFFELMSYFESSRKLAIQRIEEDKKASTGIETAKPSLQDKK
jgi:hypothetical protein